MRPWWIEVSSNSADGVDTSFKWGLTSRTGTALEWRVRDEGSSHHNVRAGVRALHEAPSLREAPFAANMSQKLCRTQNMYKMTL